MHCSLFIVHLCIVYLSKYQLTGAERPYVIELRSFEPNVYKDGTFIPKSPKVTRNGQNNYVISIDLEFLIDQDKDIKTTYEILRKSDISNGYFSVYKRTENLCQFFLTNTNFYPHLKKFVNFPDSPVCPIPKGNYTVKDYSLDSEMFPENVPLGSYMLKETHSKGNQNLFGYTIEFVVTRSS